MNFVAARDCGRLSNIHPVSLDEVAAVRPGQYVQICLEDEVGLPSERFWVRVTGIDGTNIVGDIANHLRDPHFQYGDSVSFEMGHVIAVMNHIKREYRLHEGVTDAEVCQELGQRLLYHWQCQNRSRPIDGDQVADLVTDIFLAFGRFEELPERATT